MRTAKIARGMWYFCWKERVRLPGCSFHWMNHFSTRMAWPPRVSLKLPPQRAARLGLRAGWAGVRQGWDHEISLLRSGSLDRQCIWPLCGTISGARNLSVMSEPDSVSWLLLRRASLLLLPFQLLRALVLNHLNNSKFRISDLESPGDKSTYKPLRDGA